MLFSPDALPVDWPKDSWSIRVLLKTLDRSQHYDQQSFTLEAYGIGKRTSTRRGNDASFTLLVLQDAGGERDRVLGYNMQRYK